MTKINYLINGNEVELEVEDSFAQAYWEIQAETKREQEREQWRRRKKLLSLEGMDELGEYIESKDPTPDEVFEKNELKKAVRAAIAKLPAHYQELIYLHFYKELKQKEIADLLGKDPRRINEQLTNAKKYLKNFLENLQNRQD